MKAKHLILTRLLPKTGQIISYRDGDDGNCEAGWWRGWKNGVNKTRFVSKTIGVDDVVIDRATGLMWPASGLAAGCYNGGVKHWYNAIDYPNTLNFAGFIDWRIPNINELLSIVDYSRHNSAIYEPPFDNTSSSSYWTSTTYESSTTRAWTVDFNNGRPTHMVKTDYTKLRCVRGGL